MIIKKMTATFGGLKRAALTPAPGLNVFTAGNEGGKSTWAAFLTAMLYGIDTRERDRAGRLAAKNHYQPWSGAPMEGELQVEWQGREVTIRRFSTRTAPFDGFEAVYTATGDQVPGLTAASVGEALTGGGRALFVRSALVEEGGTAITSVPELERKMAALTSSGEEDVSYTATARTLKDWANRRHANRANGLIPRLEGELSAVTASLEEIEGTGRRLLENQARLEQLLPERVQLQNDLERHRRLAQKELNRRYGEALASVETARRELEELPPPDPAFEGLTPEQAREKAVQLREEAARVEEERRRNEEVRSGLSGLRKKKKTIITLFKILVPLLQVGSLGLIIAGFIIKNYPMAYVGFGGLAATVVVSILLVLLLSRAEEKLRQAEEAAPIPEAVPVPDPEGYAARLARQALLEGELRHCQERADDLKAQGARAYDTLELLHPPARSQPDTAARLSQVEGEISRLREEIQRLTGAMGQMGDTTQLARKRDRLKGELAVRRREYDALSIAMDALDQANRALREGFSPALNGETGNIFSALTGGRYPQVNLGKDLSAQVFQEESPLSRSALYLSAGTLDQLYLSLRLALCALTLPDCPLLLDNPLVTFDDERAVLALETLLELSRERQILLFTCHSREARWAEAHGVAVHTLDGCP